MNKLLTLGIWITAIAATTCAQTEPTHPSRDNVTLYSFSLRDASLDMTLERLKDLTGKSITVDLGVTATVTLSTPDKVTADEAVALITEALSSQGIRLENLDENTLRVRGTAKPLDAGPPQQRGKPREYSQQELDVHLQNYQMQLIREGETPLDVQLTPENIEILKREGVAVPANVGGDKIPSHENE